MASHVDPHPPSANSIPIQHDPNFNTITGEHLYQDSHPQQTLEAQQSIPPTNKSDKEARSPSDHQLSSSSPAAASSSTSTLNEKDAENDVEKNTKSAPPLGQEEKDPNVVSFDGPDDPYNPQNWPHGKKWLYAAVLGSMTLCVTFASSVFSTATEVTSMQFGVSTEVMTLGTSLFVIGFAFGPLIWGPMSELYGRRVPLFLGYFIFIIFQIPIGVATNLQTIFVCRFFGGVFASAPLGVVGGQLADFFDPVKIGLAVCVFSGATFVGPILGESYI